VLTAHTAVRPRRTRQRSKRARQRVQKLDLDALARQWQRAFDAAQRAELAIGAPLLELSRERERTAALLAAVARESELTPAPWLSPVPVTPQLLGLPAAVTACLFDLDGVLTDSGVLHALAWSETFAEFLPQIGEKAGWTFAAFDPVTDYRDYIDGRPRLEGVQLFLASRGIRLPEGSPDDPAGARTAQGLARRKGDALARMMGARGVAALPGAQRYLDAALRAGLRRGVVSASTRTLPMLELAGLVSLVEERIDADAILREHLRSRPAPDLLLASCRRLGVRPEAAVTLTHSPAGVAAGLAAGLVVIGVAEGAHADTLEGFGAHHVVPSLWSLLDARLRLNS
jgi:beta-phosphoglucomutase-like phosphatase (HAD superfamily)